MLTMSDTRMNFFTRMLFCSFFFLLSGCASYNSYVQHAREQAVCKRDCQARLMACNKVCDDSCPGCCRSALQRTERDYNHYVNEQTIKGCGIVRELNSYRDPLQCRKTTCECPTDYRTCLQACKHKIPKRLQVAPSC